MTRCPICLMYFNQHSDHARWHADKEKSPDHEGRGVVKEEEVGNESESSAGERTIQVGRRA